MNPDPDQPDALDTVRADTAWEAFLGHLTAARDIVTGPLGARTDRELAEGLRHVTRLTSVALEMWVEKGDPEHPAFTRWMTPTRKLMGDNPGTIYDAAIVSPRHTYRIRGRRAGADYLGICLYGTSEDGARRVVGNVDREITDGADGTFEVVLAASRPADLPDHVAFVELEADATDLLVRQYFRQAGAAEATYAIEVEPDPGAPPPLTTAAFAEALDRAGRWVRDIVEVEATISALSEQAAPPEMQAPSGTGIRTQDDIDWDVINRVQPTPAIAYSGAWFADLGDDEVVLVEGVLPECDYVSVQWLSRWMESGDYRHHVVALSGDEIATDADGRFTVSIGHDDPGAGNWLDTTGQRSGQAVLRALHATGEVEVTFRRAARA